MSDNERMSLSDPATPKAAAYGSIISPQTESKRSFSDFSVFSGLAKRLRYHKELFGYRRYFATLCLILGFFGLTLAIILMEFYFYNKNKRNANIFWIVFIIKWSITITTTILLVLLLIYHQLDIRIEMERHNISDWLLSINCRRIFKIIAELVICSLHPFPNQYYYNLNNSRPMKVNTLNLTISLNLSDNSTSSMGSLYSQNQLDVSDGILSVLMFMRLYLLGRVLILRSTLYHDASAQSYSAINRTALNTKFIFKSWMNLYSGYVFTCLIFLIFIWGSWSIRICETYYSRYYYSFGDYMWFTAVTFLSIGYGDIVPMTAWGKAVAIAIGALGGGCIALLVAIIASKLELSQSEKYLHNFVIDSQLNHRIKHISANIVKYAWKLYMTKQLQHMSRDHRKMSVLEKSNKSALYCKRRLYSFVREIRLIRLQRRQLTDNTISLFDIHRAQIDARQNLDGINEQFSKVESSLQRIFDKLEN